MNVVAAVQAAVDGLLDDPIRDFLGFHLERTINRGEQGIVLEVKNKIGRSFALKFHDPAAKASRDMKESIEGFVREVAILAALRHANIARILSAGVAIWDQEKRHWTASEGLGPDGTSAPAEDALHYYVMDYIEGADLTEVFPELAKPDPKPGIQYAPIKARMRLFERLISQVSVAIQYYHTKGVSHKDIKPDNIRYSQADETFIVVDFGFARHEKSPQDRASFRRAEYMDPPSILQGDYYRNDIAQFAMVLLKVLSGFQELYGQERFSGMKSALEKALDPNLEKRYTDARLFLNSVRQYFTTEPGWDFSLGKGKTLTSDGFGLFQSHVRIPVSESVLLTREVKSLIDTRQFQRLRGVRQLGPTAFVFPGANHTRFEHSVGTYALALRYMDKLLRYPSFREICDPLDESIKLTALAALLHDVGHYPYSHWIEEIEVFPNEAHFPKHEARAEEMLSAGSEINRLICDDWHVDPAAVANIISSRELRDRRAILVNSIISSVIDVDRVDYLVRDSIHCGVRYGKGIDLERLLDSLCVAPDRAQICLTDKGKPCLMAVLSCRNAMYPDVYWHKTVRACEAMFKRFVYEYVAKGSEHATRLRRYFGYSDDHFTAHLADECAKEETARLIMPFAFGGRKVYKPAYIFTMSAAAEERHSTREFFKSVLDMKYADLVAVSNALASSLKTVLGSSGPLDILIETTPVRVQREYYELQGFKFWNERKDRFEDCPDVINNLNTYLSHNRKAYIFCHPDFYDQMKRLSISGELDQILRELSALVSGRSCRRPEGISGNSARSNPDACQDGGSPVTQ